MFISDFAIKRPLITVVVMVALVVFGLFALVRLQTDEFPEVAPPYVSVSLIYPGGSPDGVENEVLDPVEEAISSISGVKKINGTAEVRGVNPVVETCQVVGPGPGEVVMGDSPDPGQGRGFVIKTGHLRRVVSDPGDR